jgi:CSLREA domain-containing protein
MNNPLHLITQFNRFTLVAALLAALMGSVAQVTPAHAASIVVNTDADTVANDGKCTLREAIIAAVANLPSGSASGECLAGSTTGGDGISFADNYTITVGSQLPFITTAITITGRGAANTIIQAAASPNVATWRVFQVTPIGNLTLDGVTVRHGRCNGSCTVVGNVAPDAGGGIYNSGTLTLTNSLISGNRGSLGGGVFNNGGILTITNSRISDNNAFLVTTDQDGGGGIRNTGTLTITGSTVSGNEALSGGGIFNVSGTLTVTNSLITGNIANETTGLGGESGGGIYQDGGTATLMSSAVTANSAYAGGGIYNRSDMTITDSTIAGNTADIGGGVTNDGIMTIANTAISANVANIPSGGGGISNIGTLTVTNSTISGNSAFGQGGFPSGGGIVNYNGDLTVASSTISGNNGDQVGGILSVDHGFDGVNPTILRNTIVSGNSPANCAVTDTIITDGGNNLDSGSTCGWGTGAGSLSNTDPQLGILANNGGPTQTIRLQTGSPAIDAGNNGSCLATDQRGGARPQGSNCDIGAYEFGAPVTFYSFAFSDVPPGHWALSFIESLYGAGVTGGCGVSPGVRPLQYCPEAIVTRDQMAVFLLRGSHSSTYNPPAVGASTGFSDVRTDHWAASWIKQLAAEGITSGCGSGNYCPAGAVTRAQMAVFLLRSKYGANYNPPPVGSATGFSDVPASYWAAAWIKQLVSEGITSGCGMGLYCPESPVTRAQMAVFLVRTFHLSTP